MTAKHNAVTDWYDVLMSKDRILFLLVTLEIQKALMETGGRSVLFHSFLADIERAGERYIVSFRDITSSPDILFELECSLDQVEQILINPTEMFLDNYAVAAQIRDVYSPKFAVRQNSAGDSRATIDIESSGLVVAQGACVDLLYIGDPLWDAAE